MPTDHGEAAANYPLPEIPCVEPPAAILSCLSPTSQIAIPSHGRTAHRGVASETTRPN